MATDRASHVQDLDFGAPVSAMSQERTSLQPGPMPRFAPEADIRCRDNLVGAHGLRRGLEIMHAGDR
jgi:hypothetical protein